MTDVLDHGSVLLVDHMASDQKVTGAARVSTGKGPEYTSKGPEADEKLIRYLMEHGHGTPFEHAVFQFFVKAPIFVVREWQRHRMASYNEFSLRYSEIHRDAITSELYLPDEVRTPDPGNKQSSVVTTDPVLTDNAQRWIADSYRQAAQAYQMLLNTGVAREMARVVLPVGLYTKFWFTINCRSLLNFLMLRNSDAAQWEIRQYAIAIEAILAEIMPMTYKAFVDRGRVAP